MVLMLTVSFLATSGLCYTLSSLDLLTWEPWTTEFFNSHIFGEKNTSIDPWLTIQIFVYLDDRYMWHWLREGQKSLLEPDSWREEPMMRLLDFCLGNKIFPSQWFFCFCLSIYYVFCRGMWPMRLRLNRLFMMPQFFHSRVAGLHHTCSWGDQSLPSGHR